MFFKLSLALLLLAFGQYASAQVLGVGKCPNVKLPAKFNWGKYVGVWYEWGKYPFALESNLKCSTATYGDAGNNTVSVRNVGIDKLTGVEVAIDGYAKILGPAELAVVFFPGQSEKKSNYKVIGTDYANYAVVYSCTELPLLRLEFIWILTRVAEPSDKIVAEAYKVIKDNRLSTKKLVQTVQDCSDMKI